VSVNQQLTGKVCMPLNHFASKIVVTAQENLMKARDQRTALMNEVLQGIRMLKFMAWERSFEGRINAIRKNELHWQARNFQIEVGFNCLWAMTPVLVTLVSFLHFTLVGGHRLTPAIAFTAVAVFSELRYALSALPETFIQAIQSKYPSPVTSPPHTDTCRFRILQAYREIPLLDRCGYGAEIHWEWRYRAHKRHHHLATGRLSSNKYWYSVHCYNSEECIYPCGRERSLSEGKVIPHLR
jgi:hypothetical protein